MGCDFYIYIYLEIEHLNGTAYVELPVKRGYFSVLDGGYHDSDDESDDDSEMPNREDYYRLYAEIKRLELTPRPPLVIYEKDAFVSFHLEQKYRPIVEKQIKGYIQSNQKEGEGEGGEEGEEEYKRHEDIGIPPESFAEIVKITRKEDRYEPSYSWD